MKRNKIFIVWMIFVALALIEGSPVNEDGDADVTDFKELRINDPQSADEDAVKNLDLAEELEKARHALAKSNQESAKLRRESATLRQQLEKSQEETKEIIQRENMKLRAEDNKLRAKDSKLEKEAEKLRKENDQLRRLSVDSTGTNGMSRRVYQSVPDALVSSSSHWSLDRTITNGKRNTTNGCCINSASGGVESKSSLAARAKSLKPEWSWNEAAFGLQ